MPRQWFLAHVLLRVLTTTLRFFGSTQWVTSEIYNWMQYLVISFLKLIRGKKKLSTKNVLQTCINFRSETLVFESGSLKQVQGSPATPRLSRKSQVVLRAVCSVARLELERAGGLGLGTACHVVSEAVSGGDFQ